MKKTTTLFVVVSLILTLCFGLSGCKLIFPDEPVHTHSFVEGKCECGESDPNYNPPHQHSFVGGKCDCGEIDPSHECIFFEGKCIICLKDDPNPNYTITGSYGVITEVVGKCEVVVDTVDVKSEEYEDISLVLEDFARSINSGMPRSQLKRSIFFLYTLSRSSIFCRYLISYKVNTFLSHSLR